jgi:hypothetical protein
MSSQQLISQSGKDTALAVASGVWTTATASDAVPVVGMRCILSAVACLADDPSDDPEWVSVSFDETTPAALATFATLTIKTWKNTGGTDPTPTAATTFSKRVAWTAVGF